MNPSAAFDQTNFGFSVYSIPPALTALIILSFGALVFFRERRTRAARLFLLLTVALAVWLSCFAIMYSATTPEAALFWAKLAYLGIGFIPTIIFHFFAILLHREEAVRTVIAIHWVLSVFFITMTLATDLIVLDVLKFQWGYYPQYAVTGIPFVLFFFISLGASMWSSIRAPLQRAREESGRLRGFVFAFALGYIALTDFLASFALPVYPMGYLAVLAFVLAVSRTVSRYRLAEITPGLAVERILETIRGSVLVTGTDGIVRIVSDAACDLLGYTEQEMVGRHIHTIVSNEKVALTPDAGDFEDVWRTSTGEHVDVSVTKAAITDGGLVTAIVYSAEDIRHRKREEALRESETRYRTLVEGMNEGLIVVDRSDQIQFINRQLCEMLGYEPDELIGRSAKLLVMTEQDKNAMDQRIEARAKGLSEHYMIDLRRKDGSAIALEISAAPMVDAKGSVIGSIGICVDISERQRAEAAIRLSEARYRLMAEHATDMISRVAPDGTLLYTSPASRALLGYEPEELEGKQLETFVCPEDLEAVRMLSSAIFAGESAKEIRYRAIRRDGGTVWLETACQAIRGADGSILELVAISRDISERMRAEKTLHYQAYHDPLTGLPNRKLFDDRLDLALAHFKRWKDRDQTRAAAVLFLDLDHFKFVNDTLGHSAGDRLIQQVATRLRAALRAEDTIARFGGDEFVILLPNLQDSDDAPRIAQKLLDVFASPISIDGQEVYTTASIGVAVYPNDGETAEALLRNADTAMYRAKERARNTFQLASPLMNERAKERLSIESALHKALERNEFILFYQPIVATASREIVGLEALIRWNAPEGQRGPNSFIGVAEESFLIARIGDWVLRDACLQLRQWDDAGIGPERLSVNLSTRQLELPSLAVDVATILTETRTRRGSIELEITETAVLRDRERTLAALRALKSHGDLKVAIDDFGTGYSSLTYLRSFPIDRVKIDRSFIREVTQKRSDAAIVGAVITMAHALGIEVVAEGVENEDQVSLLTSLGCDYLQGYYFGYPASADETTKLLQKKVIA